MILFVETEWETFAIHKLVLLLRYIPTMECAQLITFKTEWALNSWLVLKPKSCYLLFFFCITPRTSNKMSKESFKPF